MARARLLLVDADPAAPDDVRRHMRDEMDVVAVAGGDEAVESAGRAAADGEPFGVVLYDYAAGGDGIERLRETPVIVTSNVGGDAAVEGMRRGAFDYISKPWSAAELRLRVERALRARGPGAAAARRAAGEDGRRPRKDDLIIGGSA